MIEFLQKGGPLMWILLACSLVAVSVFLERLYHYHRARINVGEFLEGLSVLLRQGNYAEALHECASTAGPVARVIHAAIVRHDAPRDELRDIVQEAGQLEVPKLERKLPMLYTIAAVAPLIGLLGTVVGLIEVFGVISIQGGYVTATDLSQGIYRSLLTTAAGLMIGIPCYIAYCYLSAWVQSLLHDMERGGIEAVHLLSGRRQERGADAAGNPG